MRRALWFGFAFFLVSCGGGGLSTATSVPVPTVPPLAPHTPTPTSRIPFPPTVTVPPSTATSAPISAAAPITSAILTPPPIVIPTLAPQAATPTPLSVQAVAATPAPAAGQATSLKNWNVTIVGVEKPGQTLKTSNGGGTKQALGQWLVIAVDMSNTGKENFGFNSFDFVLKTAAGVSIKEKDDFGFEGDYNRFRGGLDYNSQIPPGVTVHAFIAFDVGPDIAGTKLEFQGNKQLVGLGL